MKKLLPILLCAALLAGCGSSASSAASSAAESTVASESVAESTAESTNGGADSETDIVVSDDAEANTANLDAAVSALEEVNPIANPRALDDFSVENELMLTMDNIAGYKGDVTNDQADCALVFAAQVKDGTADAVKAELEAYKESMSSTLYADFADKVAKAQDARIVVKGNVVVMVIAGVNGPDYSAIDTAIDGALA